MVKRSVVLLLVIVLAYCLQARDIEKLMVSRFEPMLKQMMQERAVPGFAIAVVKDGKIAYSRAFGVKNIDTGEKLTTRSLFHQASVTKPFVATAIMQLVEQGKVKLDDPVVKYLPYFTLDDERYKSITVRHMVTHTSGMPDVRDYEWDKPVYDDGALERYVRSLKGKKLLFTPGESFRYSNMAFEVLGNLIARVSGMTFEEYVQRNILTPLKMKDSTLLKKKANPALMTTPHVRKDNKTVVSKIYPYNRMHAPSSTLISNVLDMSRWAIANLNKGQLDGKRILKESTVDMMWTRDKNIPGTVGISWFIGEHEGEKTISHGGGDTGYRSYVILFPGKSLGIVAASNYDGTQIGRILKPALYFALGQDFVPLPQRKAIAVDPKILEKYVGRYQIDATIFMTISREGDKLFAQVTGQPKTELFAETESRFFLRIAEIKVSFVSNDKGEVYQAIIHRFGFDMMAKKIE